MKSEKDLMYQYIKQNDLQFYYSLSPFRKNTLSYAIGGNSKF